MKVTENMRRFLAVLGEDQTFLERQEEFVNASQTEVTAWMKERAARDGIQLTEDDLDLSRELTEEELEGLSAGRIKENGKTDCFCSAGGGGTADERQKSCACVAYGSGKSRDGYEVMWCFMVGLAIENWGPFASQ